MRRGRGELRAQGKLSERLPETATDAGRGDNVDVVVAAGNVTPANITWRKAARNGNRIVVSILEAVVQAFARTIQFGVIIRS